MRGFFKRLFFGKDLGEVLSEVKVIKVHGIRFVVKKADPIAFLDGSRVLLQQFDIYKLNKPEDVPQMTSNTLKKLQDHYTDVYMSSVLEPKLTRKKDDLNDGVIFVGNLFTDWDLANELYAKIVEFTYGKKKFKLNTSLVTNS